MSLPEIATLDVDGALRETEAAVAGDTRASFLRKVAVGGGAAVTSGSILAVLPEVAAAKPSKKQDVKIGNFALTLEYLEAAFYEQAASGVSFTVPGLAELTQLLAAHERTHVTALKRILKSAAVKEPQFDFGSAVTEEASFMQTALTLENTGVSAYLGQAGRIKQKPILAAAASILTIEARHAAAVSAVIGSTAEGEGFGTAFMDKDGLGITPEGAFDKPKSLKQTLSTVRKTGFLRQ